MLRAINKKLYNDAKNQGLSEIECLNKSNCHSIFIYQSFPNIFDNNKIILPQYKEFFGWDRNKREVLTDENWTFVKYYKRKDGIEVRDFFTPSEKGKKYNRVKELTDEGKHRTAQDILLAEFLDGTLNINYYELCIPIPVNCFGLIKKNKYLEVSINFKELFEKGLNHKESRQADMLIEFKNWNEKFGKGIAFEIYNTESKKSIKEKENDWTNAGYSYVALDINNFNLNAEEIKNERKIEVVAAFDKYKEKQIEEIKEYWINNNYAIERINLKNKEFDDQLKDKIQKNNHKLQETYDTFVENINNQELEYKKNQDVLIAETVAIKLNLKQLTDSLKNFETESDKIKKEIVNKIRTELFNCEALKDNFKKMDEPTDKDWVAAYCEWCGERYVCPKCTKSGWVRKEKVVEEVFKDGENKIN